MTEDEVLGCWKLWPQWGSNLRPFVLMPMQLTTRPMRQFVFFSGGMLANCMGRLKSSLVVLETTESASWGLTAMGTFPWALMASQKQVGLSDSSNGFVQNRGLRTWWRELNHFLEENLWKVPVYYISPESLKRKDAPVNHVSPRLNPWTLHPKPYPGCSSIYSQRDSRTPNTTQAKTTLEFPKILTSNPVHLGKPYSLPIDFNLSTLADNTPVSRAHIGFVKNWWAGLEIMHNMFAKEHNYVCAMLRNSSTSFSEEELYQTARLVVAGVQAKIHTLEWTPALLNNEVLNVSMHNNW